MGGWFRRKIRSLEDVKGLKFRIAGLGGLVFERLGACSPNIAPGDIYPALDRGDPRGPLPSPWSHLTTRSWG